MNVKVEVVGAVVSYPQWPVPVHKGVYCNVWLTYIPASYTCSIYSQKAFLSELQTRVNTLKH